MAADRTRGDGSAPAARTKLRWRGRAASNAFKAFKGGDDELNATISRMTLLKLSQV